MFLHFLILGMQIDIRKRQLHSQSSNKRFTNAIMIHFQMDSLLSFVLPPTTKIA